MMVDCNGEKMMKRREEEKEEENRRNVSRGS